MPMAQAATAKPGELAVAASPAMAALVSHFRRRARSGAQRLLPRTRTRADGGLGAVLPPRHAEQPGGAAKRLVHRHRLRLRARRPGGAGPRVGALVRDRSTIGTPTASDAGLVVGEALGLKPEQLGVAAVRREQLVVAALLDDPPAGQDDDVVGVAHAREAVRDQERGRAPRHVDELVEEGGLGPNVQGRRGLVEDEDGGAALQSEQRPRDGESLPLAAGQLRAVFVLARQRRIEARAAAAPAW